MDIKGVCPIAPAVFADDGTLDLVGYCKCCEKMIELGAQALTLFGIAGEYYKLEPAEEERLIDSTVDVCRRNGVPVIISNTKHSTFAALRRARRIEDAGADCMMVLPPFFLKPGGAALYEHINELCASVKIPVMFQYAPEFTGITMSPELLAGLAARHRNFRYFKIECRPPGDYISELLGKIDADRKIFIGNAGLQMIEGFCRGAYGVMPGPSMPDVYRKIWDALLIGDETVALRHHMKLTALLNHIMQNVEMIIYFEKVILKRRGMIESDCCRMPGYIPNQVDFSLFEQLIEPILGEFLN